MSMRWTLYIPQQQIAMAIARCYTVNLRIRGLNARTGWCWARSRQLWQRRASDLLRKRPLAAMNRHSRPVSVIPESSHFACSPAPSAPQRGLPLGAVIS